MRCSIPDAVAIIFAITCLRSVQAEEASLRLVATLKGHTEQVRQVVFSPTGKVLASCSQDGTVKLWDVSAQKEIATFQGHTGDVYALAFSPTDSHLASGGHDATIRIWDLRRREQMKKIEPKVGTITGLSYFPDGKTLVVQSIVRDFVTLWHIDSGSSESIPFRDSVGSCIDCSALSADGRLLAVGGVSARVVIRDLKAKRQTAQLEALPKDVENLFNLHEVLSLAFSSDGKLLAASCGLKIPSTVTLWALEPVALKTVVCAPRGMSRETVWCVGFSPDATLLAYAGDALVLWDVNRARPFASWSDGRTDTWPPVPIYSVAFSPKGNLIASAHFDATVKLFSYANATATSK